MTQRFNAPPGWNVPPDFVPSADWQPDPSWPPAPEGWTFWVDGAAPVSQPGAPYGAAPQGVAPGSPYGTPPVGAYGSTAPGSAQAAVGEAQYAAARKSVIIGAVVFVAGIGINVWSLGSGGRGTLWWGILLVGLIVFIRGLVEMNKAKKALAATQGPFGVGGQLPGVTPPGNPPGTF